MVPCIYCGKSNQPRYKFCLYCGGPLESEAGSKYMSNETKDQPAPGGREDPEARPGDLDPGETPLPVPRPPPAHLSGESAVLPQGGGQSASGSTRPPAASVQPGPEGSRQVRVPEPTLRPEAPMRPCPACQAPVPVGFQFCGQCGARMEAERRPASGLATGRLVLMRPDGSEGGSHPLHEGVNLVGRGSGPLFDADSYLSPMHVQIELLPGGTFTLRDAGSLNGVFIKLTEEEPISDGAVFRIGQELLRFDAIRMPRPLEDGTEIMGSPNPGYWGRIAIIIGRAQDGSCFPLFGDAVVLGRERGDILFSEDGYVSGTHARISYRHGQVYLQDLASSNGTFLKVRGERNVRSGTFILMGQQLFRVMLN